MADKTRGADIPSLEIAHTSTDCQRLDSRARGSEEPDASPDEDND